jgi:hypothetical protein
MAAIAASIHFSASVSVLNCSMSIQRQISGSRLAAKSAGGVAGLQRLKAHGAAGEHDWLRIKNGHHGAQHAGPSPPAKAQTTVAAHYERRCIPANLPP